MACSPSSLLMSSNSPSRLAMAPPGSGCPSSVVTMPQVSTTPPPPAERGVITVTLSWLFLQAKRFVGELALGLQALELVGHRARRRRAPG